MWIILPKPRSWSKFCREKRTEKVIGRLSANFSPSPSHVRFQKLERFYEWVTKLWIWLLLLITNLQMIFSSFLVSGPFLCVHGIPPITAGKCVSRFRGLYLVTRIPADLNPIDYSFNHLGQICVVLQTGDRSASKQELYPLYERILWSQSLFCLIFYFFITFIHSILNKIRFAAEQ